jgi:branched-chain amino acid transport system substrate-binding protein
MVELLVGAAGPFSGPRSCYGEILKTEIQRNPLPIGVTVILADDRGEPVRAELVAREFIDRGVNVVLGHFNSECAEVARALYGPAGIPLILPASTRPSLTGHSMVFRLCPNDHDQIAAILDFMRENGLKHGTIWTDGSPYGQALRGLLVDRGGPVFGTVKGEFPSLFPGTLVICFGAHYSVAAALTHLRSRQPDLAAICCEDCSVPEFAQLVGDAKGIWIVAPVPDFADCVRQSLSLIGCFIGAGARDVGAWLARPAGPFTGGENLTARFEVVPLARRAVC